LDIETWRYRVGQAGKGIAHRSMVSGLKALCSVSAFAYLRGATVRARGLVASLARQIQTDPLPS
jgi:hypothetical protein